MAEKLDPYMHKERFEKWKQNPHITGVSKTNEQVIIDYINEMEHGINVNGSKKGSRSYIRLNTLKSRIGFIARLIDTEFKKEDILKVTEAELIKVFNEMREGKIKTRKGQIYKSVSDYVKCFKAFWHWHQKKARKEKGKHILDITIDLDCKKDKPKFVYFTDAELKKMADIAKYEYRVMMWFMFDSGIRSPTELMNVKVSDLADLGSSEKLQLNIRDEISKTFGRKIKLMLCSDLVKDYIKTKGLKGDDYLFQIQPKHVNQYLKRLGEKALNKKGLTMYDFRHSSACYWLPRYKNENALKYRFGWSESSQIQYYTEFLGMKDTIEDEDLLIDTTKAEVEKNLEKEKKARELLEENFRMLQNQMQEIQGKLEQPNKIFNLLFRDEEFIKFLKTKIKGLEA